MFLTKTFFFLNETNVKISKLSGQAIMIEPNKKISKPHNQAIKK